MLCHAHAMRCDATRLHLCRLQRPTTCVGYRGNLHLDDSSKRTRALLATLTILTIFALFNVPSSHGIAWHMFNVPP
jgi:hypothetical protein